MASRMIAFALGIGCVAWLPSLPSLALMLGLGAVGIGLAVVSPTKTARVILCWFVCVSAGASYGVYHGQQLLNRLLPPTVEGSDLRVVGRIVSTPDFTPERGGSYRFEFVPESWPALCRLEKNSATDLRTRKLRLSFSPVRIKHAQNINVAPAYGQRWAFSVRLKRPRSFANPGGFDYAAWLVAQGIEATGYVRSATLIDNEGESFQAWRSQKVRELRTKLSDPLYSQGAVLLALATGDRGLLSEEDWDQFRLSGTSHLMAISGLHIGIAASVGWVLGRVAFSLITAYSMAWLAPTLALLFAGAYAWIAGFSLPTQRAFVMVVVAVMALVLTRHVGRWQAWSVALALVLILNPMASLQAGFWLSFTAVAVLLAIVERDSGWQSLLRAQWVLLLGLAPLGLALFQQATLLAFPVNLVAVPLFSLGIVPMVLLALVLELSGTVFAAPVWSMANSVLALFMAGLDWVTAHGQFLSVDFHPRNTELLALLLFAGFMSLPRVAPVRYLALLCVLPLLAVDHNKLPEGHYRVKVLDVGQGLSVLVQTRNHNLLYDLGPSFSERFTMVDAAVMPVLRQGRIAALDRLVISHRDNDHAGAWQRLLASVEVGDFVAGANLAGSRPCIAGERWQWDGVEFAFLAPDRAGAGGNNDSCVLYIQSGAGRSLLPGDIEAEVEQRLMAVVPEGLSLLVAPHHGSKTSSSEAFVSRLNPEMVIFSAGYKHHYGHPAERVQARYRRQGAVQHNTAESGLISVQVGPEGLRSVHHFRDRQRFYWNTLPE